MNAYIVYAFPHERRGGNPAAIVLDAENLPADEKQAIATRLGFSETAFVAKDTEVDFLFEFFTPNRQIANCGHATVGALGLMRQLGRLDDQRYRMRTLTGTNDVWLDGDRITMAQRAPTFAPVPDERAFWRAIGFAENPGTLPPRVVNTGNNMIVAALPSAAALAGIRPDLPAIEAVTETVDAVAYYLYTRDVPDADASVRMFGPRYGIPEEAATGMGAGPLGAYLYTVEKLERPAFEVRQGAFMSPPMPSRLDVALELRDGQIERVLVTGGARVERTLEV